MSVWLLIMLLSENSGNRVKTTSRLPNFEENLFKCLWGCLSVKSGKRNILSYKLLWHGSWKLMFSLMKCMWTIPKANYAFCEKLKDECGRDHVARNPWQFSIVQFDLLFLPTWERLDSDAFQLKGKLHMFPNFRLKRS